MILVWGRLAVSEVGRSELGAFLRSRRERLTPEAVGLPGGRRRRTPGLRREEVASQAGIGVDWYVRLEQGRMVSPSVATVDALARALRLSPVEHVHLRALARNAERRRFEREEVPETVRQVVLALNQPAYVTGRRWDILLWNDAAAAIFDFGRLPEEDRNILVFMLTCPAARSLFGDGWTAEAQRMVAQFRVSHDLWARDPAFLALSERLQRECPAFAGWWETHEVRSAGSGRKVLHLPGRGVVGFAVAGLQVQEEPGLRVAVYAEVWG